MYGTITAIFLLAVAAATLYTVYLDECFKTDPVGRKCWADIRGSDKLIEGKVFEKHDDFYTVVGKDDAEYTVHKDKITPRYDLR